MNYLRYFTSYFSSEQTNYGVKDCLNKDKDNNFNKNKFDEFDEQIINSLNKNMIYNTNITNNTNITHNMNYNYSYFVLNICLMP